MSAPFSPRLLFVKSDPRDLFEKHPFAHLYQRDELLSASSFYKELSMAERVDLFRSRLKKNPPSVGIAVSLGFTNVEHLKDFVSRMGVLIPLDELFQNLLWAESLSRK